MRLILLTICLVVFNVSLVLSFSSDNLRVKRSNETEGYTLEKFKQSVKDGAKTLGTKVSNVASKGYNELKNLFSSDRKVGDYRINQLDVRVAEEEDYEEVGTKQRTKRDVDDHNVRAELEEIMKDIKVFETSESK